MRRKRLRFTTTHLILISFLAAILVGAGLLALPVSSASGKGIPFADALFTAATSTCVTGLVVAPTVSYFSTFGHVVILFLIQIGGLGIITVIAGITVAIHRKMGLSDRALLQDAFNLSSANGVVLFLRRVLKGTFLVEGVGALLYCAAFVPQFGARGVWISVFTSVSAFCNAGIDIIGEDSLCGYAGNPLVLLVTSALIILGGIGYIVWWDIIRVFKERKRKKGCLFRRLSLHSKIALTSSAFLLVLGTALFYAFESGNADTLGTLPFGKKLLGAFFQSVTTRTAGFAAVPQEKLTNPSAIVSLLLMFIGGSPVGTAGGIKTVTFTVLAATALSAVKNKNDVSVFGRTLSMAATRKALAVCFTSFTIVFVSTLLLSAVCEAHFLDLLYETVSACATVGLSRGVTTALDTAGKLILTATMYFGRVGPISLAIAFNLKRESQNIIKTPIEEISVG